MNKNTKQYIVDFNSLTHDSVHSTNVEIRQRLKDQGMKFTDAVHPELPRPLGTIEWYDSYENIGQRVYTQTLYPQET